MTFSEQDFKDLASGKANPMQSFMAGKIKFKGNMAVLMKVSRAGLFVNLEITRRHYSCKGKSHICQQLILSNSSAK